LGTNNFDALHKWRGCLSVPHRMPDAIRYFVAQQLSDPEAVARLSMPNPEHRCEGVLAFSDESVLKLPDEVFQDVRSYRECVYRSQRLVTLHHIQNDIQSLATQTRAIDLFEKAAKILDSLDKTGSWRSPLVRAWVQNLWSELYLAVAGAFCAGRCWVQHAREGLQVVNQAQEFMLVWVSCNEQELRVKFVLWLANEMARLRSR
jgi:hypothetical protein